MRLTFSVISFLLYPARPGSERPLQPPAAASGVLPPPRAWMLVGVLLSCLCAIAGIASAAQSRPPPAAGIAAQAADAPPPPPPTPDGARDYVSRLSDEQVRGVLIQRLDAEAAARSAREAPREPLLRVAGRTAKALWTEIVENVVRLPAVPTVVAASFETFLDGRPAVSGARFLISLAAAVAAGLAAAWVVNGYVRKAARPASLMQSVHILMSRLLLQLGGLAAFFAVAMLSAFLLLGSPPGDFFSANLVIGSVSLIWLVWVIARFLFAPRRADLRLFPLDDASARFLMNRTVLIAAILVAGHGLFRWTSQFGFAQVRTGIAFWSITLAYALAGSTIWSARRALSRMLIDTRGEETAAWRQVARLWPGLAVAVIAVQWLVAAVLVATGHVEQVSLAALHLTLALVLLLPAIELGIRPLVRGLLPANPLLSQALQSAHLQTQRGLVRILRTLAALAVFVVLIRLWDIDLLRIAERGVGERVAGALFEIVLLVLLAYGASEAVRIWIERQLAIERARIKIEQSDEHGELEGGREGSRILTLFPLLRWSAQIFILVFAALAILGALGINTGPLLAGAGIVGIALGFGSQALVRDIISGIFFLADDAFRRGEYVEVGDVKGTVESISIRSMQLRHQNGPLNTIPFGEIKHLKNYSRDWVIMKLPLRLTFDTDVDKVRRLIKALGTKLLQDPEIGPKFLQPLKSQGVIEMDDSAMIVRVKFMTKPGNQWPVRSRVYAEIRALFEREGIGFASREVRVRVTDSGRELGPGERDAVGAAAIASGTG
ncbi:MAG: mechanosensitive ion channel family protein [Hyphomicrobiaceae bacterium]|nr:mechanosensitive ion channel family protein [Hyphomicrobiaceae bacterium]